MSQIKTIASELRGTPLFTKEVISELLDCYETAIVETLDNNDFCSNVTEVVRDNNKISNVVNGLVSHHNGFNRLEARADWYATLCGAVMACRYSQRA